METKDELIMQLIDQIHELSGQVQGLSKEVSALEKVLERYTENIPATLHDKHHTWIDGVLGDLSTMKRGFFQLAGASFLIALGAGAVKYFSGGS